MIKKLFLALLFVAGLAASAGAQRVNTATFNIRQANRGDSLKGDGWGQRCPVICSMIRYHDFDIFGAQEVFDVQLHDMLSLLPGYGYTGRGRDDGAKRGEYSPIFYKKEVFTMLDSGMFWLSETPDVPAKGWDASYTRICTWGRFRHNESGKVLWFFNTHFDHRGVVARRESAKQILATVKAKAAPGETVVVMGDLNVDQHDESYALLANSGVVADAYQTTEIRYANNGTFNHFDANAVTDSRIDHIYITPGCRVLRYGVLTDVYWPTRTSDMPMPTGNFPKEVQTYPSKAHTPSDHYPVAVQIVIP